MAYGLDTLGAVDWYAWGSDYLLPGQRADGSWEPVKYGSVVNTSLALLFLTKSNSVRELAGRIKGGAAANKSELRTSPMAKAPALAPTVNEEAKADPKVEPKVEHKSALPAPLAPGVQAPIELTEGEKIASALMSSSDGEWAGKLSEARDAKGAKWTRGLALACGRLEPERKRQAREALADRLTRMTSMSLREMFEARDAELRRGACLAAGMKDDRLLIPGVIGRITDPSEAVVRAARESLKSIGHVDHGPPNGADPDAKAQAAALWRKWFESLPK